MNILVAVNIVSLYALFCYQKVRHSYPINYLLLLAFTLSEAYVLSFICLKSDPMNVAMAFALVSCMSVGLTIYAFTATTDFTLMGGSIFIISMIFLGSSFLVYFLHIKILIIAKSALGTLLFGIYLIYDTQLIVGDQKNKFSIDDYILASLSLYLDVINIFLEILQLLQNIKN